MIVKDFKDADGNWVRSFGSGAHGEQKYTWLGRKYKSMCDRAKIGGAEQRRYPRYAGTTTTFSDFQDFAEWAVLQPGYAQDGFELDKDLLSNGLKVYCKETSIFVPKEINLLFNKVKPLRGEYGIGVQKFRNRFRAKIKYNNKNVYLGVFNTPTEAFLAYKTAKEEKVKMLAEKYRDMIDPRCYELLMAFEVKEDD